jgi:drug/metabolite transporter (DMT)-like permease
MKSSWLIFALLTVICWGLYGILLHKGQVDMADKANGKYKAFLFVGIAYFLIAVLAPLIILLKNGVDWKMPASAITWSLLAGVVGALGAFFVLLAFANKGTPNVVMSIIFAGAPIINAVVAIMISEGIKLSSIDFRFYLGILMAAGGGCLVTFYKPKAHHGPETPLTQVEQTVEEIHK